MPRPIESVYSESTAGLVKCCNVELVLRPGGYSILTLAR